MTRVEAPELQRAIERYDPEAQVLFAFHTDEDFIPPSSTVGRRSARLWPLRVAHCGARAFPARRTPRERQLKVAPRIVALLSLSSGYETGFGGRRSGGVLTESYNATMRNEVRRAVTTATWPSGRRASAGAL